MKVILILYTEMSEIYDLHIMKTNLCYILCNVFPMDIGNSIFGMCFIFKVISYYNLSVLRSSILGTISWVHN